jgi:hypothetical protein
MKKFLIQLSIISIITLVVLLIIISRADGYTDPFYIRFTTPKQQNMILGTSRAAQGLRPEVFQQLLNKDVNNFAFTVAHSPFGKVYYETIQRKHNKKKGGLFIIAVDPWSISSWCSSPNDLSQFRENNRCLDKIKTVDSNPNFSYLLNSLPGNYSDIFLNNGRMFLHENGWFEITVPMDSTSIAKRTSNKVKDYRFNLLPKTQLSSVRLEYLIKTINYLKEYGSVYLVRLPIHKSLMEIEDELTPNFESKIKEAIDLSNGYLDLTPQNDLFDYTDGNHLHKSSAEKVSTIVALWIKETMPAN